MPSFLITGASRGLGLGFATELLKNPANIVIATARDTANSQGLHELKSKDKNGQLYLVDLDVSKPESIKAAAEKTAQLLPEGLDHLVSNAGISVSGMETFEELDVEALKQELDFTISAPIYLLRGFLPLIRKGQAKRILVVSSTLGSLEIAPMLPNLANGYSVARAALTMLVRKWSPNLKAEGITIAVLHPGWVGVTEIGDQITEYMTSNRTGVPNITVEESSAGSMKVLTGLTLEDSGAFLNYDGNKNPL